MQQHTGDSSTDKDLVTRVLDGDRLAFAGIVRRTERLVTQIIFRMIANAEDRKDLAQEIYLKVFHRLPGFRFESKLSTWIGQVSYNTCFDYLKKKRLPIAEWGHANDEGDDEMIGELAGPSLDKSNPANRLQQRELSGLLQEAIDDLPPVYKTLVTLYHTEELSYEEIMQITQLPEGTVKNYLFRARRTLKTTLLSKYKREEL